MRYVDLQRMFDDGTPAGVQYYVKPDFLTGLNPDALGWLATHGRTPSSPRNQMLLRRLGGRIADIDPAATAFATRDAQHMLLLAGAWTNPTDDPAPHRDWVRGAWDAVRPWARGTYVNHLGDEGTARLREAYPPTTWR